MKGNEFYGTCNRSLAEGRHVARARFYGERFGTLPEKLNGQLVFKDYSQILIISWYVESARNDHNCHESVRIFGEITLDILLHDGEPYL